MILRNLTHYWRTNAAVVAGVAVAVAVLSGALLVGQSVSASLRALLLQRLGATEYVVSADRFFREDLAAALVDSATGTQHARLGASCPIIALQGTVVHERTGRRAYDVNVFGVDDRFWTLQGMTGTGRTTLAGSTLVARIGAAKGDTLLLRVQTGREIPTESLFGRRENLGRTIRLECDATLAPDQLGEFALRAGQGEVLTIFVPLARLQRELGEPSRANAVLIAGGGQGDQREQLRRSLEDSFRLDDVGVRVRDLPNAALGAEARVHPHAKAASGDEALIQPDAKATLASVETTRIMLDDSVARAAFRAAQETGAVASGVFTYLANSIRSHPPPLHARQSVQLRRGLAAARGDDSRAEAGGREIPYSVISAVDPETWGLPSLERTSDPIVLTEWAARDLGAAVGDAVEVDYYSWQDSGDLITRTATFHVASVVPTGAARGRAGPLDSSLAPDVPGVTDAKSLSQWDPPFPIDFRRIRPRDEEYWKQYRATPKALIPLARGQELWQSRFGRFTAVRVALSGDTAAYAHALRSHIDPEATGFTLAAVRREGLEKSRGAVDLGEYFVYFSSFLILAALLLSASFFKLGVEQRAREIGTLQAVGFPVARLRRMFLLEGAVLSIAGTLIGLAGGIVYGAFMLLGLRSWWIGAVGTDRLSLSVSAGSLGVGALAGILTSLGAVVWTLRRLRKSSPRTLLAGALEEDSAAVRRARMPAVVSAVTFVVAMLVLAASALNFLGDTEGFFGGGALLLVSSLGATGLFLRRARPRPIQGNGWPALLRLGVRSAMHRPGRSLFCVGVIASATFVIVSVEAFRKDDPRSSGSPSAIDLDPHSGTGGYALVANAALPLAYDPNSGSGRDALGIPFGKAEASPYGESEVPELAGVRFVPFRVRPGDEASCLNLYAPREPRILGAPHGFVAAGRFAFAETTATNAEQTRNPWLLLESAQPDGAIPAIGDANTIEYSLHLAVGQELIVRGNDGAIRLRLVGALRDSMLQGELIISEANFVRAFPRQEGYRFFLVEAPAGRAAALVDPLTERLADWNVRIESSSQRLSAYHRVENTYLSTFQSLGALGLVLGTIGLAAILFRNVLERRKELALLRAVGYRRPTLSVLIVTEHAFLMAAGLTCGTIAAFVAIGPAVHARGGAAPFGMVIAMLVGVLAAGAISAAVAAFAALRGPVLATLRSE
jgi:ABC-type lipoprotein release transport system permease subunit